MYMAALNTGDRQQHQIEGAHDLRVVEGEPDHQQTGSAARPAPDAAAAGVEAERPALELAAGAVEGVDVGHRRGEAAAAETGDRAATARNQPESKSPGFIISIRVRPVGITSTIVTKMAQLYCWGGLSPWV